MKRNSNKFFGFLALIILILAARTLFFDLVKVNGESMCPTLNKKQIVFELKYKALTEPYNYGDIVTCFAENEPKIRLIKRVVGCPGDKLQVINGILYVNGVATKEPYVSEAIAEGNEGCLADEITLGSDEYFVMGDNRNHSSDSRFLGMVKNESIEGRVILKSDIESFLKDVQKQIAELKEANN